MVGQTAHPSVTSRPQEVRGVGWTPVEPMLLGLALVLLFLSIPFPWWGIETHMAQTRPGVFIEETVHFSPWISTYWYSIVAATSRGSAFWIEGTPIPVWDFSRAYPDYAAYTPASGIVTALWSVAVGLILVALWFRAAPRRRLHSVPTIFEGVAAGCLIAAVLYVTTGFSTLGQFPSFSGVSSDGLVFWGPGVGWYLGIAASALGAGAAVVGLITDLRLRGLCWSCHRPVSGRTCGFCASAQ